MPLPSTTRFSSIATSPSSTNKNNGLYAPTLNTAQIAAIPDATKVNGGIWYNESTKNLEAVVNNTVEIVQVGQVAQGDVVGPGVSIKGNIAVFGDTTGKLIADSGVATAKVPNPIALLRFSSALKDSSLETPNLTVNEIGNLGHVKFTNGLGLIFVDGLMPVEFITNTYKTVTQVCSLFTDGLPSSSTSPSALVEIQSDTGALLLSRMTQTERDNLSTPSGANGMLLFNTTNVTFDGFDGTNWRAFPQLNTDGTLTAADPTASTNLATKNYVDTRAITLTGAVSGTGALGTSIATTLANINTSQITNFSSAVTAFRLDQFAVPTSNISMGSKKITSLLDPSLAQDAATKNYVDTSISGSGFAPGLATYIVQTAANNPTNAQVLGSLTTGLLKNTTTTGVLTIGVAGTDYYSPGNPTRIIDDTFNFFIGTNAGNFSLPPGANTGIGIYSLSFLVNGQSNTAVGFKAQQYNVNGNYNTSCGRESLGQNTNGSFNTAVGYQSLYYNTSEGCTAVGYKSLYSNITGSYNTATGYQALTSNTIGINNTAVGNSSLAANTTGSNNTAVGNQALTSNTTGFSNSAFGIQSLYRNTGGNDNASFGLQALFSNTTGQFNNAFGNASLYSNTTGQFNNAFGRSALYSNVSNSYNVAIGYEALVSSTSDGCTAVGHRALYSNTISFSAAFGSRALFNNTTGNSSGFGFESLFNNTTGNSCGFGYQALYYNTTGNNNCSFGNNSGSSQLIYNNCIFLGTLADASINNLTNAIAIGYQASVGASNCMVLGGSGANQLSVGIGITPNAQLQLPTIHANRKFVLYGAANNDHQVFALGTASGIFRFQADDTTSSYTWNAGASSSTSNELMRLTGTGTLYAKQSYASYIAYTTGGISTVSSASIGAFTKLNWPATGPISKLNNYSTSLNSGSCFTWTGGSVFPPGLQNIMVSLCMTHNGVAGEVTTIQIYKNGSTLVASVRATLAVTGSISVSIPVTFGGAIDITSSSDFFDVRAAHSTASKTLSITEINMTISST